MNHLAYDGIWRVVETTLENPAHDCAIEVVGNRFTFIYTKDAKKVLSFSLYLVDQNENLILSSKCNTSRLTPKIIDNNTIHFTNPNGSYSIFKRKIANEIHHT